MEVKKKCKGCSTVKPLGAYYTDKRATDGRRSQCIACHSEYTRAHQALPAVKKARNVRQQKYSQTPRYVEWRKRYRKSEKGQQAIKKQNKKQNDKNTRDITNSYLGRFFVMPVPQSLMDAQVELLKLKRAIKNEKRE